MSERRRRPTSRVPASTAPTSRAPTGGAAAFSFQSLGVWRKLFLIVNWAFYTFAAVVFVGLAVFDARISGGLAAALTLFAGLCLAFVYWVHKAVVTRDLDQLLVIGILCVVPFGNPVGAVIVFSIRSTSKAERLSLHRRAFTRASTATSG